MSIDDQLKSERDVRSKSKEQKLYQEAYKISTYFGQHSRQAQEILCWAIIRGEYSNIANKMQECYEKTKGERSLMCLEECRDYLGLSD